MWSQTQKHQRFGFRQTGWGEPVLLLKLLHGVACRRTPYAVRLVMEKAGFNQCLLYLPDPRRLDADMPVTPMMPGPPSTPVRGVRSLLLSRRQLDIRDQQCCQHNERSTPNPPPTARGNIHVFHINAEYQPETSS